ncbi:TNT domain-containing protein [Mycobacterium palustre]|uniref:TNT domain-containing protein n=1 Tax=Mycobacterium palustre TaxID=153971 RepID=UPI001FE8AACA|nr:TNT domain-containing protein [Mycobacterium palustre]
MHSDERSGDGWDRLPDKPTDLHYGEPLPEHWSYPDNPADLSHIDADVRRLMDDPKAPFGRDSHGHAYSQTEYEQRFNKVGPQGQHWYNFPGNSGAVLGTRVAYSDLRCFIRDYGSLLDRIGDEEGTYLAVMENGQAASWEQRALHTSSLAGPYNSYRLSALPSDWTIEISEVAPGLGQPGGSLQVQILDAKGEPRTVEELMGTVLTER